MIPMKRNIFPCCMLKREETEFPTQVERMKERERERERNLPSIIKSLMNKKRQ